MRILLLAILAASLNFMGKTDAACKTHDASWNRGVTPRVTQPARSEPEKVVLDWNSAIHNARCVDFYNIYVWKTGQPRNKGQKIVIANKTISKADLIIDPCVEHRFAVEFVERDWTHTDEEISPEAKFKTEAIPQFVNQDKNNFAVTYHTDPIRQYSVVDKVSIKFRKNIIKHASCVKHIEIKGVVDNTPPKPIGGSSQTGGRSSFGQRVVGGSSSNGGSSQYNPGGSSQYNPGGSSYNPGGSSQYNPGGSSQYNPGGSSQYNPGGSSQYNPGGSSQYNPGGSSQYNPGGSSQYNPGGSSQYNPGGSSQYNPGGSSQYDPSQGHIGSWPQSGQIADWGQHILPDNWNGTNWNNHRRHKRSAVGRTVQKTVTPPFNGQFIEVLIPVKPCTAYKFELKIVTPRNAVLGQIKDLRLPWLTEMYDFKPPPLSKIIKVSPAGAISFQPSYRLPATCRKDFFVAIDNHVSILKNDVLFHMNRERQAHQTTYMWSQRLDYQKRQQLSALGCGCNSTLMHINGTSKSSYQKYMGLYHFEGMHQGKPYYMKQGEGHLNSSNVNQQQQAAFFYWEPTKTMWNIGPTLGAVGNDAIFRTKDFSNPKCPADAGNLKNFQYSGTLKWKNEPTLRIECMHH